MSVLKAIAQTRSGSHAAGGRPPRASVRGFGAAVAAVSWPGSRIGSIIGVVRRAGAALTIAAGLAFGAGGAAAQDAAQGAAEDGEGGLARTHVVIEAPDGARTAFAVEVADTAESRSRGLMFRPELAQDAGMLFIFERPSVLGFWMRNTLISLDIIYFTPEGRLLNTRADARPLDETSLPSAGPAQFVLEINAGLARRLGLATGSTIRSPALAAFGLGFVDGDQEVVSALEAARAQAAADGLDAAPAAE